MTKSPETTERGSWPIYLVLQADFGDFWAPTPKQSETSVSWHAFSFSLAVRPRQARGCEEDRTTKSAMLTVKIIFTSRVGPKK